MSEQPPRALSSALDIQHLFPQVSATATEVLPHDRLTMTLHDGMQT